MRRYIVVTGGVLSGLGKGVVTASIGRVLKNRGYSVAMVKIDGYVNVDAGTMNPFEHGEVFVLEDGAETDLDLGHYERFLDVNLTRDSNITTGLIYKTVIEKERRGEYLGKTVQIIPHVTDEIKRRLKRFKADVVLVEVGGTVGDIENMIFIEALRQLSQEEGNRVLFVHVSYIPVIVTGEQKTKPSQHSVRQLQSMGIQPTIIIGRCEEPLKEETRRKIAIFCGVRPECVISNPDIPETYELPILFEKQGLGDIIVRELGLEPKPTYSLQYEGLVKKLSEYDHEVRIGIVGKYTTLVDAYLSIKEAFKHVILPTRCKSELLWIDAESFDESQLEAVDGLLVPGGFGRRGAEEKIAAIKHARENGLPFLGICFGMQLAVVEFARSVCGLRGANSTELDESTSHPVIDLLPEQRGLERKGGTMRLGSHPCKLKPGTLAYKLYETDVICERHRHRWEVNPSYVKVLESHGLIASGIDAERGSVEIVELPSDKHPFFIACQFHPEFKSRLKRPAPLFVGLVRASLRHKLVA